MSGHERKVLVRVRASRRPPWEYMHLEWDPVPHGSRGRAGASVPFAFTTGRPAPARVSWPNET